MPGAPTRDSADRPAKTKPGRSPGAPTRDSAVWPDTENENPAQNAGRPKPGLGRSLRQKQPGRRCTGAPTRDSAKGLKKNEPGHRKAGRPNTGLGPEACPQATKTTWQQTTRRPNPGLGRSLKTNPAKKPGAPTRDSATRPQKQTRRERPGAPTRDSASRPAPRRLCASWWQWAGPTAARPRQPLLGGLSPLLPECMQGADVLGGFHH